MAYFRCGGGSGLPAGLQSGMDSVLNKKFGTSTTYPPSGWPSDVNLLGPLPVKTASGAIASFSDGADDVPVKSCVVTFTPSGGGGTPSSPVPITGYTGLTLTNKDNITTPTQTETITDTFGQTIYGGTRDLTTDKASVTWKKIVADGVNVKATGGYAGGANRLPTIQVSDALNDSTGIKAEYLVTTSAVIGTEDSVLLGNSGTSIVLHIGTIQGNDGTHGYSSDAQLLSAVNDYLSDHNLTICYKIATPTEITGLTSHDISTMLGDNNFYADVGNTAVEYRADIQLALNP